MKKAEPVDPATRPSSCTQELVAGYWLIQVKSKEEAIEWAKRAPFAVDLKPGAEAEIEMRPFFDEPPSPARGER
ncbi:MAG: hypothetical protein DMF80_04230 [Acidobacteria bacterium]|nr:MAG: hypothetical protein DMF80_04230 [Acidobacteriota bacterium]